MSQAFNNLTVPWYPISKFYSPIYSLNNFECLQYIKKYIDNNMEYWREQVRLSAHTIYIPVAAEIQWCRPFYNQVEKENNATFLKGDISNENYYCLPSLIWTDLGDLPRNNELSILSIFLIIWSFIQTNL